MTCGALIAVFASGTALLVAAAQAPEPQHLHWFIDKWLLKVPLSVARWAPILLFVIAAVWAMTLKRSYVMLGAPDQARWRDLRIWTVVFLIPYVLVYWWLG